MLYTLLNTKGEVDSVLSALNNQPYVVLDIETTGLDPWKGEILDVQIMGDDSKSVFIFPGRYIESLNQVSTKVVGHNLKFDIQFLYRKGVDVSHWRYHDTMLLGHLIDENRESYSLDSYVREVFKDDYKEEFWKKYGGYEEAPQEEKYEYGAKDVIYTRELYRRMGQLLNENLIPQSLVSHVHELQSELLRTELFGVRVDLDYLTDLGVSLKLKLSNLAPEMRRLVSDDLEIIELDMWSRKLSKFKTDKKKQEVQKPEFNFSSSGQLKDLLYGHLGLPVQYNDKTKQPSTDYDSLQKIRDLHPVIGLIQEHRELEKVYTAYVQGTIDRVRDGRIYPEFRVSGTHTSRISHQNPNLGQLPKSGGVKGIYIADDGELFSDHDYGQLEVCIEAHFTQDKNLLEIVLNGASKHDITANNLKISRDLAKTLNFASQYFCGPRKIAQIMSCSQDEALYIYNKYWETYSGVKVFKAKIDKEVDERGYVADLFGRRRRFSVKPRWEGDKSYRQAYNFVIQSTGGQIMNNAFYKASQWIRTNKRGRGGMWTVHDSGLFSHKKPHAEDNALKVNEIMVTEGELTGLTVPLKVDYVTGCGRWMD